jgi:biotin transport system substrate-specific component
MLCGTVLGAKRGALAVLLFLVVGLIVPVFPGFTTTWQKIQSPSIGYVVGFPIAAFVAGLITQNTKLALFPAAFAGALIGGIAVLYAFGIPGMAYMLDKPLPDMAMAAAAFLPGDLIKAVLAALITKSIAQMRPEALLSRG